MRKIHKIANTALIFTLVYLFMSAGPLYPQDSLRVPMRKDTGKDILDAIDLLEITDDSLVALKKIKDSQLTLLGSYEESVTLVQEAIYIDEGGNQHKCFTKTEAWRGEDERFIIPQVRILRYLEKKGIKGIPKITDFVELENDTRLILFEKFPKGETLDKKIGNLSPREVVDIILGVSRIVKSLFDNGIYHWDIKPKNIYITDGGEIILFDFDFAFAPLLKDFKDRGLDQCGTFRYMSTNRMKNRLGLEVSRSFCPADEVYSVALSLAELLGGMFDAKSSPPFLAKYIIHQLENSEYAIPDGLPSVLKKALSKEYSKGEVMYGESTYETIDAFIEALEQAKNRCVSV